MRSSLSSGFRMASVDVDNRCTNGLEIVASVRIGQATSLGNLGRLHLEQGDAARARERLEEAREIFKAAGAEEQLGSVRRMLEEVDRILEG